MKRLLALVAIAAVALLGPGVAQAHAGTCAPHQLPIVQWSTGADSISGIGDFQCGGASFDFGVFYELQVWNGSDWVEASCDAGPCESSKPSSGFWQHGTEHTWTWNFNVSGQIDCRFYRTRSHAYFDDGSLSQNWLSAQKQTC